MESELLSSFVLSIRVLLCERVRTSKLEINF